MRAPLLSLAGLILCLATPPTALGASADALQKDRAHQGTLGPACVTAQCHAGIATGASIHGPVAAKQCGACHVRAGGEGKKDFALTGRGAKFCESCHEEIAERYTRKFIHGPSAVGDCTACHFPHRSSIRYLLREGPGKSVCYVCHDQFSKTHRVLHGPVGAGNCTACHDPHASDHPFMLRGAGAEFCFLCHDERRDDFFRAFPHEPTRRGCVACHDPHGGEDRFLTKGTGPALCASCHKDQAEAEEHGFSPHTRALGERVCSGCHTPHSSDWPKQLRGDPESFCISACHPHAGLSAKKKERIVHKPFANGSCFSCHSPHATTNPWLLKLPFTETSMQYYEWEAYELCWSCHVSDIVEARDDERATGFRNGAQNMHALHVEDQEYSCRVCHEEHGGGQPVLIRNHVFLSDSANSALARFVFTRTATGGDCVVQCHGRLAYDRVKPVIYE